MAKNYNLYEVARILNDGSDLEAVIDVTRRFGPLAILMTKVVNNGPEDALAFLQFMPEYITANKINTNIKNGKSLDGFTGDDDDTDDAENEIEDDAGDDDGKEKPAKKAKAEKSDDDAAWIDTAKGPELFKAAQSVDKSLGKGMKVGDLRDQVRGLIDDGYLDENGERTDKEYGESDSEEKPAKKAPAKKSAKKVEEPDEEDVSDDDDDEEEDDPKKAVELFKQCKKLGIKVKAKQTAKFYQEKIDEFNASKEDEKSDDEDDEDDDWDI